MQEQEELQIREDSTRVPAVPAREEGREKGSTLHCISTDSCRPLARASILRASPLEVCQLVVR